MPSDLSVFVLGAGASRPYGFPLGRELVDQLARLDSRLLSKKTLGRYEPAAIDGFKSALERSRLTSIDRFLQNRPHYLALGKAAIAFVLMPREREDAFSDGDANGGIYAYLYNEVIRPQRPDDLLFGRLAFITYNYDRSLEHYLLRAIQHSFGTSEETAAGYVAQLPIYHLHGSFGSLPGAAPTEGARAYKSSLEGLTDAESRLRIVSEDIDQSRALAQAHLTLAQAARVVFLGFSYDETNVKRLKLAELLNRSIGSQSPNTLLLGTCLDITQGELAARVAPLFEGLSFGPRPIGALEFLRNEFWGSNYRRR